jgi:spore coat protein U-like protein
MPLKGFAQIFGALCAALLCALPDWAAAGCTASSSAAAFNVYNTMSSSPTTTTATVTVTCQAAVQILVGYVISLSAGSSGSVAARTMQNGASAMAYQIYSDPTYSTIWGDGTGGSQTVSDGYLLNLLTPVVRNYTAYGRIPALQNLAPGAYQDTITILVTY